MKILLRAAFCCALVCTAAAAGAAGATIVVTHELDAARPGAIVSVPFADIDRVAPGLRMFHVVVRDAQGPFAAARRSLTTSTIIAAPNTTSWCSSTTSRPARNARRSRSSPWHRPRRPKRPACMRARCPERHDDMAWENDRIAHRMYGMALNSPRRGRRAPARQRHRRVGQARYVPDHRSLVRQGARPVPQGRGRRRPRSLQHRRLARRGRHGCVGRQRNSGPRTISCAPRCSSNGPRRAVFVLSYAPWDAGTRGNVSETKRFTVDCGRNFDTVESVFDFAAETAVVGIGLTQHASRRRISGGRAHERIRTAAG